MYTYSRLILILLKYLYKIHCLPFITRVYLKRNFTAKGQRMCIDNLVGFLKGCHYYCMLKHHYCISYSLWGFWWRNCWQCNLHYFTNSADVSGKVSPKMIINMIIKLGLSDRAVWWFIRKSESPHSLQPPPPKTLKEHAVLQFHTPEETVTLTKVKRLQHYWSLNVITVCIYKLCG